MEVSQKIQVIENLFPLQISEIDKNVQMGYTGKS